MIDEQMNEYWSDSAKPFSNLILYQLEHEQKQIWIDLIYSYKAKKESMNVLDIGCGPAFLRCLWLWKGIG